MIQVQEGLSPTIAKAILEVLPQRIQTALTQHAVEVEEPIEAVLEMAIISFLDLDAMSFDDCRTETPGRLRERVEILESIIEQHGIEIPEL
jgi:hypothetical protein